MLRFRHFIALAPAFVACLFNVEGPLVAQCLPGTGTSAKGVWSSLIQPIFPFDSSLQDNTQTPDVNERYSRQRFPMHALLLRNGKILIIPTEDNTSGITIRLLDPTSGTLSDEIAVPNYLVNGLPTTHALPCAGHITLSDGRVLLVGGTGSALQRTLATVLDTDPIKLNLDNWPHITCNNCWIPQDPMPSTTQATIDSARFYPTCTVLGDGRVLVTGGSSDAVGCPISNSNRGNIPMIFDVTKPPGQQWPGQQWSVLGGGQTCPGQGLGPCTLCENYSNNPGGLPPADGAGGYCQSHDTVAYENQCSPQESPGYGTDSRYPSDCSSAPAECNPTGVLSPVNAFHLHYYPHMFLLTDGRLVNTGSTAGPWEDRHPKTRIFDKDAITQIVDSDLPGRWSLVNDDPLAAKFTASVMYRPNLLMKAGGRTVIPDNTNRGEDSSAVWKIDMTASSPTWQGPQQGVAQMAHKRLGINLVVLPDGKIIATNGIDRSIPADILTPEIYDTDTNVWCEMAAMADTTARVGTDDESGQPGGRPADGRGNHTEALLLPDARVLVMGGETDSNSETSNNNAQIFSPPYLFDSNGLAARPTINSVSGLIMGGTPAVFRDDLLRYHSVFTINLLTGQGSSIQSVSLVKLGASTHSFDQDQRFVPLHTYSPRLFQSHDEVDVDPPFDGNAAPPGYYMLFVLNASGVPSVSRMVRLCGSGPDCNGNGIPDDCDIAAGIAADCNHNYIPDSCDIASQLSVDCDGNGVPDDCPCPTCACPTGLISSTVPASPPSLTHDARQPHPANTNALSARQGIGSASEPIRITLTTSCGNIGPQCFQLCETGQEQLQSGAVLSPNQIASVTRQTAQPYTYDLVLARPISAGHWTTIKYWSGSKKISYASLPGDVNANGVASSDNTNNDTDALQACVQNALQCPTSLYLKDINHSGSFTSSGSSNDVTTLADLFNGAGTFRNWNHVSLPTNNCFPGPGGPYCTSFPCEGGPNPQSVATAMDEGQADGGSGDETPPDDSVDLELSENEQFTNAFVSLLTESDPVGDDENLLFSSLVITLIQWTQDHFSAGEKAVLLDWLGDPERTFASQAGHVAAVGAVQALSE